MQIKSIYSFNPKGLILFIMTLLCFSPFPASGDMAIVSDTLIRDQKGREISVHPPFKRIISLYGAHTENLFSFNTDQSIIGVSTNEKYPEEALEKPVFSYRDDPEKFLRVKPDLVLIRPMIDRSYTKLIKRLESMGIKVVSLQPKTIEEMYLYWKILGRLTGKEALAQQKINRFKTSVGEFTALSQTITPKKQVYFEAIHKKFKTFTPGSFAGFALEASGGVNIASDATSVRGTNIAYYGKERLLSKGAKIDAYIAQQGKMNRASIKEIKSEPGYQLIKAVRKDAILIIDETLVSRPTFRLLQAIYIMGEFLYGERFTNKGKGILERAGLEE